ncbi:N-acetyl-L,L-diaminopimelate deacetylase, partial [hydrothermal vent metagenome]
MNKYLTAIVAGAALLLAAPVVAQTESSYLENLYFDLHQNPELSLQEFETAKRMKSELEQAGFTVTAGVGGTGLVAIMKNGKGPVLMLRAD